MDKQKFIDKWKPQNDAGQVDGYLLEEFTQDLEILLNEVKKGKI